MLDGIRNAALLDEARAARVADTELGVDILGLGSGWCPKDYEVYCYDYGTVGSRMALFAAGLARIERRLQQLKPAPVRPIPILIGGSGGTLPLVGRHADIWHSFLDLDIFRRKNTLVKQHAADAGRDERQIERSVAWSGTANADVYADEGVSLFTTEIHPTDTGYDLSPLDEMLSWRDSRN